MKFFGSMLGMILLSLGLGMFLPWWSVAIAGGLVGIVLLQKPWIAFVSGFTSIFIGWIALAGWISVQNGHILAKRVSELIFQHQQPLLLVMVTAFIGAIIGGFSMMSGVLIRKALIKSNP
jgi:hypothetical protein